MRNGLRSCFFETGDYDRRADLPTDFNRTLEPVARKPKPQDIIIEKRVYGNFGKGRILISKLAALS